MDAPSIKEAVSAYLKENLKVETSVDIKPIDYENDYYRVIVKVDLILDEEIISSTEGSDSIRIPSSF